MNKIDFTQVEIEKIITHQIGNKLRDERYSLSNDESILSLETKSYLLKYFFSLLKTEEFYEFTHAVNIEMNEVFTLTKDIFSNTNSFIPNSQNIAKLLYEQSMHPKIKDGQLNVSLFNNVAIDDEVVNVIGIFKSETPSPFIQMKKQESNYNIIHEIGFDLKSMDKGCLIFNTNIDSGYKVLIIDNASKSNEAQYWKDDFLNVCNIKNEYHQTNQFLGIAKQFVTNQLDEDFEVSKADKIDFLNRSVDYFKKNETFDKKDFEDEVFGDSNVIESFRKFDHTYRQDNEVELADNFQISSQAVKKQSRVFKSVLKLDRNFDIYIHGNKELIEKGTEKDGRKYYKIYYEEEK
ncbi:nucleoid-associated protein [Gelidibacter sp. F2691]|nr:nucleoid-associated protein [Gelidibacter sp. F2691]